MDVTLTYYGKVENGKIEIPGIRFRKEVGKAFDGKRIEVLVRKRKRRRSVAQNAYYWGLVLNILTAQFRVWDKETEITAALVHDWCKDRFLPIVMDGEEVTLTHPGGKDRVKPTTTRLTTTQFMDYIALIQKWAAEYGLYIPDPNEWEFESVEPAPPAGFGKASRNRKLMNIKQFDKKYAYVSDHHNGQDMDDRKVLCIHKYYQEIKVLIYAKEIIATAYLSQKKEIDQKIARIARNIDKLEAELNLSDRPKE